MMTSTMCSLGHSSASAATTGMGTGAATEGGDAGSCSYATNVERLISIGIATVLHPQHPALGFSHPLPDTVNNKFVNILRFRELLAGYLDQDLVSSIILSLAFN